MGYQIRMAPQVEAWLAAVRDSDPAAADRIDEAVGALRAGGDRVGPPLVVTVDDPARSAAGPGGRRRGTGTQPDTAGPPRRSPHALAHWPWRSKPASDGLRWLLGQIGFFVARPGLDAAYKRQLVTMTRVRRAVADVATSRARLERQAGQLDQQAAEPPGQRRAGMAAGQGAHADEGQPGDTADEGQPGDTAERLASLRQRYANLQAREERLMVVSRRFQAEFDAFRDGQEAVVAAYTAAEEAAEVAWAEVAGNVGPGTGNPGPGTGNVGPGTGNPGPRPWHRQRRPWYRQRRPWYRQRRPRHRQRRSWHRQRRPGTGNVGPGTGGELLPPARWATPARTLPPSPRSGSANCGRTHLNQPAPASCSRSSPPAPPCCWPRAWRTTGCVPGTPRPSRGAASATGASTAARAEAGKAEAGELES